MVILFFAISFCREYDFVSSKCPPGPPDQALCHFERSREICHPNQAPHCHLDQAPLLSSRLSEANGEICLQTLACLTQADVQISRLRPAGSARNDRHTLSKDRIESRDSRTRLRVISSRGSRLGKCLIINICFKNVPLDGINFPSSG